MILDLDGFWIAFLILRCVFVLFLCGFCALFIGPTNNFFNNNNFKTESHDSIHTFKNYFDTVFSIFNNKQYPNKSLITSYLVYINAM